MKDISTNNKNLPITLSSNNKWFAYSYSMNDKNIVATIQLSTDLPSFISRDDIPGFGNSISFNGDGSRIAIGGDLHEGESGVVIIYEYDSSNNEWNVVGDAIRGEEQGERMGTSVSLSSDGNRVGIGAPFYSIPGLDSGRARVYEYKDNVWTKVGIDLLGSYGDKLGSHVELSSDGNIFAVGGSHASTSNGIESGQIKVYNDTEQWTLLGTEPIKGLGAYLHLGNTFSLSSDGLVLSIAASPDYSKMEDDISNLSLCNVYKFNVELSEWNREGSTYTCIPNQNRTYSTALSGDGARVAFGSQHLHFENGTVHVLEFTPEGDWLELGSAIEGDGTFGSNLVFGENGKKLGLSSTLPNTNSLFDGNTYIYEYEND